ncbi:MAG: elongation factor G [Fuerstiella sp.]|nr:elongation factor G [Fuerstiella sp.]
MVRSIESLRNIGIIAHIDAGKTTTTERILYYTGASHRMGNVDDGTTQTDFDPEEAQRGITIYSAAVTCQWKDRIINIIDTPGHVDFTAEVERSLRVLDGAVVIFSAVEGVEAQSETVWRQADRYSVPRLCYINKMDRIGASFASVLNVMKSRLGATPLPVQMPVGEGPATNPDGFRGVIDLLSMKAMYWDIQSRGAEFRQEEIPDHLQDEAQIRRAELFDTLSDIDDELMECWMETEDAPRELVTRALRKGVIEGRFHPVLCGSSLDYIGVQPLLDTIVELLPSPLDRPAVQGVDTGQKSKGSLVERKADPAEPTSVLIFKIQSDVHGDLYFARVYSGILKGHSRLLNPRTGKKELVTQLWHIQSDAREKAEQVSAGDICGIIGPRETATGDTLADPQKPVQFEQIRFPETVISVAVEPESSGDRKKLVQTLERLERQDPTFRVSVDPETGQTIISGMGELHIEVVVHRLERDFNLKVRVHKPRVSYRERLRGAVDVSTEFSVATPTSNLFFGISLTAEDVESQEESVTVTHRLSPDVMPKSLLDVLQDELKQQGRGGGVYGNPIMGLRMTVTGVEYRQDESKEPAIRSAARQAFNRLLQEGQLILLEPIMQVEVVTPEEFVGNIQSDLNARRALIVNSERRGDLCVLKAEAPLIRMFGYSTQIRSLSQGRASFSMEPCRYAEAPEGVMG